MNNIRDIPDPPLGITPPGNDPSLHPVSQGYQHDILSGEKFSDVGDIVFAACGIKR